MMKTIGNLISRLYHDLTRSKVMISFSEYLNTKSGMNIKQKHFTFISVTSPFSMSNLTIKYIASTLRC